MHLTLLVPELIWPEPDDQFTLGKLSAPGLAWLLAHAQFKQGPRRPFEHSLADQFGVTSAAFGPLRLLGEGEAQAGTGHWLCADPVHLRFHHERIVLADAGAFELDREEALAIADSLNQMFADIGVFHVSDTRRWYLQLNAAVDHPVAPISAVAGRRMDSELPQGDPTLSRWLNEVQMFLHGHPVNEARQRQGKPAINSLWLWGGGSLPATCRTDHRAVFADNPLACGLAQASQIPYQALPENLSALLPQSGSTLVVLDSLLPPVLYEDGPGWRSAFEALEKNWFSPLKNALGKQVDRIDLIAPTIYGELHATITAGERWKFWKKARPLPDTARQLAENAHS